MLIVISKLVETKSNSKDLSRYLDKVVRPLVFVLPRMSGYVYFKYGDKDKNNNL